MKNISETIKSHPGPPLALSNNNFPDFLWYDFFKLIKEKTAAFLNQNGLTGFQSSPVTIMIKQKIETTTFTELRNNGADIKMIAEEVPPYFRLWITGKAQLHQSSNIIYKTCPSCGITKPSSPGLPFVDPNQRKVIDLSKWDGSDFFLVEHFPSLIFCSEKFFEIYQKSKLTGLRFDEVGVV